MVIQSTENRIHAENFMRSMYAPLARATVIAPENALARFPPASTASTRTAGLTVDPEAALLGCCVKRSWVGGGGGAVILSGWLVPPAWAQPRSQV